jgi:hypothetical protein
VILLTLAASPGLAQGILGILGRVSSNVLSGDEYAEFAEALEETGLYGVGAYFCDQHPDLVDAVIEQSAQIERLGLERYASETGMTFDQCHKTLLTGLAVRYYTAVIG